MIRDVKARQDLVRSILEDEESQLPDFIGKASLDVPVGELADRIVKTFGINIQDLRGQKTAEEAFGYLRTKIEQSGIFVFLVGNLGRYHTNIPVKVFRGYASADRLAPMIVINDQDAKEAAWSFTALHELVHLWLGDTGIARSDIPNRQNSSATMWLGKSCFRPKN